MINPLGLRVPYRFMHARQLVLGAVIVDPKNSDRFVSIKKLNVFMVEP